MWFTYRHFGYNHQIQVSYFPKKKLPKNYFSQLIVKRACLGLIIAKKASLFLLLIFLFLIDGITNPFSELLASLYSSLIQNSEFPASRNLPILNWISQNPHYHNFQDLTFWLHVQIKNNFDHWSKTDTVFAWIVSTFE